MLNLFVSDGDRKAGDLIDLAKLVVEHAADPIFVMDQEGGTLYANPAAERTFGWSLEELRGQRLHDVIHHHHPDGRPFPMAECPLADVFGSHATLHKHEDVFFRRDGTQVPVACSNAPIERDGRMIGAVLIAVDITARRQAEQRQRLLLDELNHRVKNTLATVQGIVIQTLRTDPTPEAVAAVQERLLALSRAHDVLTREQWEGADIRELAAGVASTFGATGSSRFKHDGPPVRLSPTRAVGFALSLHELATNALKYGALSSAEGEVALSWSLRPGERGQRLSLVWEERNGPRVSPPARCGFGTRLIDATLGQGPGAEARFDYRPTGLVFHLEAPIG